MLTAPSTDYALDEETTDQFYRDLFDIVLQPRVEEPTLTSAVTSHADTASTTTTPVDAQDVVNMRVISAPGFQAADTATVTPADAFKTLTPATPVTATTSRTENTASTSHDVKAVTKTPATGNTTPKNKNKGTLSHDTSTLYDLVIFFFCINKSASP